MWIYRLSNSFAQWSTIADSDYLSSSPNKRLSALGTKMRGCVRVCACCLKCSKMPVAPMCTCSPAIYLMMLAFTVLPMNLMSAGTWRLGIHTPEINVAGFAKGGWIWTLLECLHRAVTDVLQKWSMQKPKIIMEFSWNHQFLAWNVREVLTRDTVSERWVLDFDDASHCYMIRENSGKLRALSGSVTFLASQMAEDFDAAAVLQRMRNGKAMFVTPCMAQSRWWCQVSVGCRESKFGLLWECRSRCTGLKDSRHGHPSSIPSTPCRCNWNPWGWRVDVIAGSRTILTQLCRPGSFGLLVEDESGRACLQPAEVAFFDAFVYRFHCISLDVPT